MMAPAPRVRADRPRPARCETCGFSSRHTIQKPGEKLRWMVCCHAWMCEGCRDVRGCTNRSDATDDPSVGRETALQHRVPTQDGVWLKIPDQVYHGDRASLSSSGARTLLWESPEQFLSDQLEPPNPKPEYDFGHGAHKYVLREGSEIVEVDADTWRGKDAQIERQAAWKASQIPLLTKDVMKAKAMADAVMKNRWAKQLLAPASGAVSEASGYWHDPVTGVRLRFRPDRLVQIRGQWFCVDYKTMRDSADTEKVMKSVADYKYHQQQAWYEDGCAATGIDDVRFVFIFQSKKLPYLANVVELPRVDVERGRQLNRLAIDLYASCKETDTWHGLDDTIHTGEFPRYAVYREEQLLA